MRNRLRVLLVGLILLSFVALAHGGSGGGSVWDPPESITNCPPSGVCSDP